VNDPILSALFALPLSLFLSLALGAYLVPALKKMKLRQYIREEGPASHQSKGGTPTMGGLMFLFPILAVTLIFSQDTLSALVMVLVVILTCALGFVDDLQKVLLRNNKGITPRQKLLGQGLIGALLGGYLYGVVPGFSATLNLPFTPWALPVGWAYIPFVMFFFTATTNAVNLTDGLDGLAATVTLPCVAALVAMLALGNGFSDPLSYTAIVMGLATLGGCLGFLWFNSHPAQVFMGDTGSLALGAVLVVMCCIGRLELWFPIIGLIFVAEALSVVIQVFWFKRTKKRVFRMSPLHHHYELGGWKEVQVVNRFAIVAFSVAMVSVLSYYAVNSSGVLQ